MFIVISGGGSGLCSVIDTSSNTASYTSSSLGDQIDAVAYIDETKFAVGISQSSTYSIKVLYLADFSVAGTISSAHSNKITGLSVCIGYAPYLLSISTDNVIKNWNLNSYTLQRSFLNHSAPVVSVACLSFSTLVASAANEYVVYLWVDYSPAMTMSEFNLSIPDPACSVTQVAGNILAVGTTTGKIYFWNLEGTRGMLSSYNGHSSTIIGMKLYQSNILVTADNTNCIKIWNWQTNTFIKDVVVPCTIASYDITLTNNLVVVCKQSTYYTYSISSSGISGSTGITNTFSLNSVFAVKQNSSSESLSYDFGYKLF